MGVKGATLLQILQYQTFMGKSCRTMSKVKMVFKFEMKVNILTKKGRLCFNVNYFSDTEAN